MPSMIFASTVSSVSDMSTLLPEVVPHETITNKDESGDPKNYNLQIKANVVVTSSDGQKSNNNFEKNISLSAQDKKIDERELEKKYIKDLSELIGKDIIFFLINQ